MRDSTVQFRLDDETRKEIEDYAREFYPKPNREGNLSEAIRQTVTGIFELAQHPDVKELLQSSIVLNGDIMVFVRVAIQQYIENERAETTGVQ